MALAVCLLLDDRSATAVRGLWRRLEAGGTPTLLSHTHGRHVPHLSYAALRTYDLEAVADALTALPPGDPMPLHFDALGTFRRSRCWLAPAVTASLVDRQQRVFSAIAATGAELHHHYRPGWWLPHLTLAPRLRLEELPRVAALVYDVLPLEATAESTVLVDTSTGSLRPLPHLV